MKDGPVVISNHIHQTKKICCQEKTQRAVPPSALANDVANTVRNVIITSQEQSDLQICIVVHFDEEMSLLCSTLRQSVQTTSNCTARCFEKKSKFENDDDEEDKIPPQDNEKGDQIAEVDLNDWSSGELQCRSSLHHHVIVWW